MSRNSSPENTDWMDVVKDTEKLIDDKRRGTVALEAFKVINGARLNVYGQPENAFETIKNYWNCYTAEKLSQHGIMNIMPADSQFDIYMRMALFKIARIQHNPKDRDGYRDAIGYLALACDMACAKDHEKE